MMRPIVLATDGSPSARAATELAIALARDTGASLWIVAAWEGTLTTYPYSSSGPVPEIDDAECNRAWTAASDAAELAREAGVETELVVREGRPADIVSDAATNVDAAMIVVGSHGWGALRRLAFGSVSRQLLHDAPCPVLIARGQGSVAERVERARETASA